MQGAAQVHLAIRTKRCSRRPKIVINLHGQSALNIDNAGRLFSASAILARERHPSWQVLHHLEPASIGLNDAMRTLGRAPQTPRLTIHRVPQRENMTADGASKARAPQCPSDLRRL